jgi:hypothetical protein
MNLVFAWKSLLGLALLVGTVSVGPSTTPPTGAAAEASAVNAEAGSASRAQMAIGARVDGPAHSFYFTRGVYSGWGRSWATDAPAADRWIASVIRRLTFIDISPAENFVPLDDPDLGRFPFVYVLEVGRMGLTKGEAEGLRDYLLRGGFLMVDDFWGSSEWSIWEEEIRLVLPEYDIVEIPLTHEIFSTMYQVDEIVQVPSINGARSGITSQRDGIVPHVRGIFDEAGRLMVVINWNTDIGDAWEWAEAPYYPLQYSTYAYQVAANTLTYALTH